jgi:mannosyltransferase
VSALVAAESAPVARVAGRAPRWWPLAALIVLAAALRLSTLTEQSFWYDEAFTPVHVLHEGLGATWRSFVHSENTPPLWYLLAWVDMRLFGDGAFALRLPSALAGIATVPVVWAIGERLAGGRAGLIGAALLACNPLFVWYSQEARAYGLFVLCCALAMLCFVRALQAPTRGRLAAFALSGALALLTHYFAVFLLVPMALWLLRAKATRRAALPALACLALVGLALLPLIAAQGGQGTQWIGRWALSSRLQAIPQYFLTGYSGKPLGHGVELLVALPLLAAVLLGGWKLLALPARRGVTGASRETSPLSASQIGAANVGPDPREGAWIALSIFAFAVLVPIALAALGADYLAPRNLLGAMIPLTVLLAIVLAAIEGARGAMLAAASAAAFLAISVDVDLSPRLQRGNWREVAKLLRQDGLGARGVLTTVELGAAPLEYYLPELHLRNLPRHTSVYAREIDETGYAPLREGADGPPAPGFQLRGRRNVDGLIVYRFISSIPRTVPEADLRRHVITLAHPEVLVPSAAVVIHQPAASAGSPSRKMSSSDQNI